ncbi:hypothetical protein Misp01_70820 [Microtetraspora sp. NBRC 13810]|uniref:hypothetical protein n=1 Tax=Microtetraspora sp. NBRC 13810 TaxID=3030990 RepID=UPI0024A00A84|nr:hypothetical protein [Microtetraspora sp. NBRC 13810]GLW11954.1 hypothetical protein Misp01_70820 [Microtetraspora sp. NBRC 13810]
MKDRTRVALAVAAGYLIGRRRRSRGEGGLLSEKLKGLGATSELGNLTGRIRGDLLEIGKAAAVAATSRQIDSLSNKLHDRAESLRSPGKRAAPEDEESYEEEPYDEEDLEEEYDEDFEEEPEERPRRERPRREPAARQQRSDSPVRRRR